MPPYPYQMYANEYKGAYPPVQMWHWPVGNWGNPWWDDVLLGKDAAHNPPIPDGAGLLYVLKQAPDYRIFYCPAMTDISWTDIGEQSPHWEAVARGDMTGLSRAHNGYFHYANWYHVWGDPNGHVMNRGYKGVPGPNARRVDDRADRVIAADIMTYQPPGAGLPENGWNNHQLTSGRKRPDHPDDPNVTVIFEGGNTLFNDGHVEWHTTAEQKARFIYDGTFKLVFF